MSEWFKQLTNKDADMNYDKYMTTRILPWKPAIFCTDYNRRYALIAYVMMKKEVQGTSAYEFYAFTYKWHKDKYCDIIIASRGDNAIPLP